MGILTRGNCKCKVKMDEFLTIDGAKADDAGDWTGGRTENAERGHSEHVAEVIPRRER